MTSECDVRNAEAGGPEASYGCKPYGKGDGGVSFGDSDDLAG